MPENLKTVARFNTPIEADVVRNRLEASGVRAFLADEYTVGWLWHLGTGLHGVKVQVADSDLSRALEILEDFQQVDAQAEPSPPWLCPKCSAEVDAELEVCWACGTTPDGVEDAEFQDAEAAVVPQPTRQVGPKPPPGPALAVLITFCIPMFVFNTLIGIHFFETEAVYPMSGGLILLVLAGDFLLVVGLFQWAYYQPPSSPQVEAAAERLETATDAALAEQEDRELAAAGAVARRACLAALLGILFCPLLNFYSIWLILTHELYRPAVRRQWSFFISFAIVVNALVCLVLLMLLLAGGAIFSPWGLRFPRL